MEKTYLEKCRMLLEEAKSRAESTRIFWRSADLGPWVSVNLKWTIVGGRIRIQFRNQGRPAACWIASVSQKPWGVCASVTNPGNPIPEPLEMRWQQAEPESADPRRLWKTAIGWLDRRYPGHRIVRASKRPDLSHTLSGSFLRVLFQHRGKKSLLIAAGDDHEEEIPHAIGQAILWLSTFKAREMLFPAPCVYLLVPAGLSAGLFHRCRLLNRNRIKAEVWEYDYVLAERTEFHRAPEPPAPEEEKDFRWPVLGPFRWSAQLESVLNLAPALIRRYPRFRDFDSLRIWGLEFAQVTGADRNCILFGVGGQRSELKAENFDCLRSLVEEILFFRRADSPDIRHPFYRMQAERWLEALMLEETARLFPELAPESVYSQIPVYLGQDSGRIDILGADRNGTLVVMELKVSADPDLPIQALDYWGRVIQHSQNGDFERRGYFSETKLTRNIPKIYLVSPVFSFHDKTEALLRFLDPNLEVWKIAVNEDWRCGVKIVRRVRYRCGD